MLAYALGHGLVTGLLLFAVTYVAMSKLFGFTLSGGMLISLLLIGSFCLEFAHSSLEEASKYYESINLFNNIGVPFVLSVLLIFVAKPLWRLKNKQTESEPKSE